MFCQRKSIILVWHVIWENGARFNEFFGNDRKILFKVSQYEKGKMLMHKKSRAIAGSAICFDDI